MRISSSFTKRKLPNTLLVSHYKINFPVGNCNLVAVNDKALDKLAKVYMSEINIEIALKDVEGFKVLYDKYAPCLYGMLLKLTPDTCIAEKILAESFVKIWLERDTYNSSKGRLFTWMLVITLNHCTETLLLQEKNSLNQLILNATTKSRH